MKLRKLIAVLAAMLMLCSLIPAGAMVSAAREELVPNGNLETGTASGFTLYTGSTVAAEAAHAGGYGIKSTATNNQYQTMFYIELQVDQNTDYTFTFWHKYVGSNSGPKFYVYVKDSAKSTNVKATYPNGSATWKQETVEFNSATNEKIYLYISNRTANDGGTYYFDDFSVLGPDKPEMVRPELVPNGNLESGNATGFTLPNGTSVSTASAHLGVYGIQSNATNNQYQSMLVIPLEVKQNTDYTLSFWHKYVGSHSDPKFYVYVKDQNKSANVKATYPNGSATWKQETVEFNSGTNTQIYIYLSNRTANDGGTYYFDDFSVLGPEQAPVGQELVTNGDFEEGNISGWSYLYNGSTEMVAGHGSNYAARVTTTQWNSLAQTVSVTPNTRYQVTYWAKVCSNMTFLVKGTANIVENSPEGSEWKQYTLTFNSGSNSTVNLMLMGNSADGTCVGTFDDVAMIQLCDECNSDAAYTCQAGVCTVCGGIVEAGEHTYNDQYDADCNACGETRLVPDRPLKVQRCDGTSISEDVNGLAFKFDITAAGVTVNETEAVLDNATVAPYDNGKAYPLIKMGAVVSNDPAATLDLEHLSSKTIDINATYLCALSETTASFAVRIINIPEANKDTTIYARSYVIYQDGDEEVVLYGNTAAEDYNHVANPKSSIKVLAIGNSFSQDAMNNHLYQVLESAGYEEIVLGNLYIGGCDLDTHWSNMRNDNAAYIFYKTSTAKNGVWSTNPSYKVSTAIAEEEWDVITIQQASPKSGQANSMGNLDNALNWINDNKTNPSAKILWHMTWAYDEVNQNSGYANYNNDQFTMYRSILDATNSKILANGLIDGVIPSGTSIQNMRTSSKVAPAALCEGDGYHLSANVGDYIAALTWYAYLSGEDVSGLAYQPSAVAAYRDDINASVNAAIADPYKVTKCASYDTTKSIKVLSIGHSFSKDVMQTYLYEMLEQAGYEEITLGFLYYPGCSLSRHWEYISTGTNGHEQYGKNVNGTWTYQNYPYAINVLQDEDWDVVTLQPSPGNVGGQNEEYSYIPGIIDWIQESALNANVDVKWHEIWAYSEGCDLWSYTYHNFDQMTMYNNIIAATKQHIVPNDDITGIIPVGTAVQNARAKLGDIFNEPDVTMGGSDGYHLNNKYGDFLGSLTWACYFGEVDSTTITLRSEGMTEEEFAAIAQAVNDALANPLELTE